MTVEDVTIDDWSVEHDPQPARRAAALVALGAWLLSIVAIVVSIVHLGPVRASDAAGVGHLRPEDPIDLLLAFVLSSMGAVIVIRSMSRRYGWMVLGTGTALAVLQAAEEVAAHAVYVARVRPAHTDAAVWIQDQGLVVFVAVALLLPSLFPDGRAVGRWRRPVRILVGSWVVLVLAFALTERSAEHFFLDREGAPDNPLGLVSVPVDVLNGAWLLLTLASFVVSIGSLRARWRDAGRDRRQQLKWVLLAIGITGVVLIAAMANVVVEELLGVDLGLGWVETTLVPFSWVLVAVALGLGVLRYRLYDVDLVINRSMVYAVMSTLVVATYVVVVVVLAEAIPAANDTEASLVATGFVALGFAPVRSRVQAGANHLMFGRRSDPIGVLTELGHHLTDASAPDAVLETVAETVTTSLKLPGAAIELAVDGRFETHAVAGIVEDPAGAVEDPAGAVEVVLLRYQREVVGRMIVVRRRRGEPLHADDRSLLENLAHHAAALAHAVRLNVALQQSREQLVLAREEERRRLRRDLHDGLGPSLASQTFRLDAVLASLDRDPVEAAEHVHALKDQTRELVSEIRRLVYELRPPALDELGLSGALAAHAGQLNRAGALEVRVATEPSPLGELPAAIEVAAYRIATEAVTNVVRHAAATRCWATIVQQDDHVIVRVEDDGIGIPAESHPGVGLTSMRERAAELGGTFQATSSPESGTTVTAHLPIAGSHRSKVVPAVPDRRFRTGSTHG